MSWDWQNLIALLLVAGAAAYLARGAAQALVRRRAGCSACAACPSSRDPGEPNTVPLDLGSARPVTDDHKS